MEKEREILEIQEGIERASLIETIHLDEMAYVTNISNKLQISIYSREGRNVPHFHIEDCATNGYEFSTCLEFQDNRYFRHGTHTGTLNSKQRKLVNQAVRQKYANGWSVWEYLITKWNEPSNNQVKLKRDTPIPDYTYIKSENE